MAEGAKGTPTFLSSSLSLSLSLSLFNPLMESGSRAAERSRLLKRHSSSVARERQQCSKGQREAGKGRRARVSSKSTHPSYKTTDHQTSHYHISLACRVARQEEKRSCVSLTVPDTNPPEQSKAEQSQGIQQQQARAPVAAFLPAHEWDAPAPLDLASLHSSIPQT